MEFVLYEIGTYLTDIYENIDQPGPGSNTGLRGLLRRDPKTDPISDLSALRPPQGKGYEKAILGQANEVLGQLEAYAVESGYDGLMDVRYV
ncbi:MAG: hypothetical protein QGG50_07695, partial [Methanopyri archaeon]|nr:hypothetical protein [Methanopyri archaeon]